MVKQFFKKKSKRVSCRKRYKIEKKVREHHRKLRREAKRTGGSSKKKNEPHVPNKCPFKESVLVEAQKLKLEREETRKKVKQEKEKEKSSRKRKISETEADTADGGDERARPDDQLRKGMGEVRKVVEACDVVVEVLDSRDPLGTRSAAIEKLVLDANKRLVLLLNKIDLVPKEVAAKWIKHLKNEFPTVPFKASTQQQRLKLGTSRVDHSGSKSFGVENLMRVLNSFKQAGQKIKVGFIGFPNVGKSSIINSLKRRKACAVGGVPGITTRLQTVDIAEGISVVDTPGVVVATNEERVVLAQPAIDALDAAGRVAEILARCPKEALMMQYTVGEFSTIDEFLISVAKRMGRLRKGGRADIGAVAKKILLDFASGKIRFYTEPPEAHSTHVSAQIVTEMAEEFSAGGKVTVEAPAEGEEMTDLEGMEWRSRVDFFPLMKLEAKKEKKKGGAESVEVDEATLVEMQLEGNQTTNKDNKKAAKRRKKVQRKKQRNLEGSQEDGEEGMETDEDFDFDEFQ